MSMEHWQKFHKNQSLVDASLPVDSVEYERLRRRQDGVCSVKSLFCCLSVLIGKPSMRQSNAKKNRQTQQQQMEWSRSFENDDDSFGYNFDDQMSPRVLTRLADKGHCFD